MTYMLDTNICIYAINNRPEIVAKRLNEHLHQGVCISAIALAELEHGVAKSNFPMRSSYALLQFLAVLEVLPFGYSAAVEYGQICAYLQKRGTPIGIKDMLIAAHARAEGLTLVTNNVREFARVPDLSLENWAE